MLNSTASPLSGPLSGPPHFVDLHVNPGESVSIQLFDGNETILRGPATITMISQHAYPPMPIPVQVPPGHMIQQIVDENGQLRHIILSAVPNNGTTNPSNTVLMPQQQQQHQQQQQQQPFPYCCCCCYSCTGTTPTTPLPPAPPPPPQIHHNILAFPSPQNRRRLNPINRTFSPAGKRSVPTYLNNNSIGKSPIRTKLGQTAAASVDGVSKVFATRHTTPSDGKPYELNSNRVLVGKIGSNENNCLSDPKHVLNKTYVNKEGIDRGVNSREMITSNGPLLSTPRPAPPFSYTSLEEHKDINHSIDRNSCTHFESSEKSPILLEINLSSTDPRIQNNISNEAIAEEVDEEEAEEEANRQLEQSEHCLNDSSLQKRLEVPENSLLNDIINDNKDVETSVHTLQSNEESLCVEIKQIESIEDPNEDRVPNSSDELKSNTLSESKSQSTNSCISSQMQDNQNVSEDHIESEANLQSNFETQITWCPPQSNQQLMDSTDSINQIECQSDESEDYFGQQPDYSSVKSSEENQVTESISKKLIEEEIEAQPVSDQSSPLVAVPEMVTQGLQRSPKHLLPQLQLLNLTYTSLTANTVKLKWAHSQPHSTLDNLYAKHYVVEMLLKSSSESTGVETGVSVAVALNGSQLNSRIVYQGHSNNCRISHLSSQQQYSFRVRTTSEEHLVVSNVLTITTPEQQPINAKYNKKSKRELLHQQIQQQQHQIHQQQLLLQQQQQLQQQTQTRSDSDEPAISSDQRWAIFLLLLFSMSALIVAFLIQQLLSD